MGLGFVELGAVHAGSGHVFERILGRRGALESGGRGHGVHGWSVCGCGGESFLHGCEGGQGHLQMGGRNGQD